MGYVSSLPIWSMYGIFPYIYLHWMVDFYGLNVGKYIVRPMDPIYAIETYPSHNHHLWNLQVHLSILLKWSFLVGECLT